MKKQNKKEIIKVKSILNPDKNIKGPKTHMEVKYPGIAEIVPTIHLSEKIDFIYNSNMIEGIEINKIEYGKWDKSDYPEINGHAKAFDYMIKHYKEKLTEKHILKMHGLLTKELLIEKYAGKYRDCNVYVGNHMGTLPISIKPEMNELIEFVDKCKTEEDTWSAHNRAETIHPFVDGNGRTGRLILNWLRLKSELPLLIINHEERWEYYEKIRQYQIDQQILEYWVKENNGTPKK